MSLHASQSACIDFSALTFLINNFCSDEGKGTEMRGYFNLTGSWVTDESQCDGLVQKVHGHEHVRACTTPHSNSFIME